MPGDRRRPVRQDEIVAAENRVFTCLSLNIKIPRHKITLGITFNFLERKKGGTTRKEIRLKCSL